MVKRDIDPVLAKAEALRLKAKATAKKKSRRRKQQYDPAHNQAQAEIPAQAQTLTQDPAHNQAQAETKPKHKRKVSFVETVDLSNEVHLQIAVFFYLLLYFFYFIFLKVCWFSTLFDFLREHKGVDISCSNPDPWPSP